MTDCVLCCAIWRLQVRPALDRLLELVPKLGPRHFSIASAPSAHPDQIELLVALVEYDTCSAPALPCLAAPGAVPGAVPCLCTCLTC